MIVFVKDLTIPADVANLSIQSLNNMAVLTWDLASDLDVQINGKVIFRYSDSVSATNWENAITLQAVVNGSSTSTTLPLLLGTYFVKFVDNASNESVGASSAVVSTIASINMNTVEAIDQEPSFSGVKNNMIVVANELQFDTDISGDLYQFGSYEFDNYIDLGSVQVSRALINMSLTANNLADNIDDRKESIDTWDSIDNPPANIVVDTYISTTNDDPAGSPTWSDWVQFTISDYTARAFKFKLEASTSNINHQILVSELSSSVEVSDKTETQRQISSGTATKSIIYTTQFNLIPVVSITATNMMTGDYHTISNETATGFDINFYNSSDVAISRVFNYSATGY